MGRARLGRRRISVLTRAASRSQIMSKRVESIELVFDCGEPRSDDLGEGLGAFDGTTGCRSCRRDDRCRDIASPIRRRRRFDFREKRRGRESQSVDCANERVHRRTALLIREHAGHEVLPT